MIKKVFLVCLAVLLGLSCFACNNDSEPKQEEKVEVPFMEDIGKASYDNFEFAADETGVSKMSEEVYRPFWLSNVIYNETVMMIQDEKTGEISGNLLYDSKKILAVKNHDFTVSYQEGVDYTVSGNKMVRTKDSAIKYHTKNELIGEDIKPPYLLKDTIEHVATDIVKMGATIYTESDFIYGYQVSVSYVYDVQNLKDHPYAEFDAAFAPKFVEKLKKKEEVNITILGDSIAEGCSSSSKFKHTPYMPNFMTMTQMALEEQYDTKVNLFNKAKGGTMSAWGANDQQIAAVLATNPDLFFIHFAGNDNGSGVSASMFNDNIQKIVLSVLSQSPDTEIIFINKFTSDPKTYDLELFEKYFKKTKELSQENDGMYVLDLYEPSISMLKVKDYMDVTGNGINHINDYITRFHSMSILAKLYDFAEVK